MVFLVFLQVNTVHGATASLSSSQSIGSATVQKVAQLGAPVFLAPISKSGNNVYITWSSNKTGGNFEIIDVLRNYERKSLYDGKSISVCF
jgi:hypothetical protein